MHEKLFNEQLKLKEKKNIKSIENLIKESEHLTFKPFINPKSNYFANKCRSKSLNNSNSVTIKTNTLDRNNKILTEDDFYVNNKHTFDKKGAKEKNCFLENLAKVKIFI